jgi:hypothetical protein
VGDVSGRALVPFAFVIGCAAPTTASMSMSPASRLLAANKTQSVWATTSPSIRANHPAPAALRYAVWVSTTACLQPLGAGDSGERAPSFDPKRCVGIVERVLVDGDVAAAHVEHVEELTIEDVAVKLEALLRGADTGETTE